jgi:hypothetical protein
MDTAPPLAERLKTLGSPAFQPPLGSPSDVLERIKSLVRDILALDKTDASVLMGMFDGLMKLAYEASRHPDTPLEASCLISEQFLYEEFSHFLASTALRKD